MNPLFKNIPSHWEIVPISSVVFFQEGPGVRKHQYRSSGVKLLNGGNINDGKLNLNTTDKYVSQEEADGKYAHFMVDEDDLLIACSGVVVEKFDGKIAYARKEHLPLCMNTSTMRFRSLDDSRLYLDYFRRFLSTFLFKGQLQKLITGSAQLNFGPSHIKQMFVPLPPLPEQKRIAAILDKADQLRQKRQQAIGLADEFLRSVFLDMFGDPVTNPKGWEVKPLGKSFESIDGGWSASGENEAATQDQLGVLKISSVTTGKFLSEENKLINPEIVGERKLLFPRKGDLLFSRANTRELVAATVVIDQNYDHVFLPDKLWRIQFNSDSMQPEFFHHLLKHPRMKDRLTSQATGTSGSMLNISKKKLNETLSILPSLEQQTKFAEVYWATVNTSKKIGQNQITLDELFNSLSQKAFAGEL